MNDTVTRLMEMIDEHAHNASEATRLDYETWHLKSKVKQAFADVQTSRQALHDELVRLFTPLSQSEVVDGFCKQPHDVQFVSVFNAGARFAEKAHGIGEAK